MSSDLATLIRSAAHVAYLRSHDLLGFGAQPAALAPPGRFVTGRTLAGLPVVRDTQLRVEYACADPEHAERVRRQLVKGTRGYYARPIYTTGIPSRPPAHQETRP